MLFRILQINLLIFVSSINVYRINLPQSTDAKCNDGQQSAYFFEKPQMTTTKFIIIFFSVGWCSHETFDNDFLGSCYQRSFTERGSINSYPDFFVRSDDNQGLYTKNINQNPHFHDWSVIQIASCDGALNQGYSKEPYMYKNKEIWFRGENTTKAALKDAWDRFDLKNASEVIIAGCSSAGLTGIIWANYIRDLFPTTTKMWLFVDSGFYVDYKYTPTGQYRLRQQMIDILTYANVEVDPINKECVEDNPNEKWKCLMAEYALLYVKVPVFVAQFEYDWWHMMYILGQDCEQKYQQGAKCIKCSQRINDQIEQWRDYVVNKIETTLNSLNGSYYWKLPCFYHCMHYDPHIFDNKLDYSYKSLTLQESLYKWMYNI